MTTLIMTLAYRVSAESPDIIVSDFFSTVSYGYVSTESGLISGFSTGPAFCNIGQTPIVYESLPIGTHPVYRQGLYRLMNGRFEQVGISWVYYTFFATNDPYCDSVCMAPNDYRGGDYLYPGCRDGHSATVVGIQQNLFAASQVNAYTGAVAIPLIRPAASGMNGRLQVDNADLDPSLNPGALYFVEGHVIAPDDAPGNADNNATHHPVTMVRAPDAAGDSCTGDDPQKFCMVLSNHRPVAVAQPAVRAWAQNDPAVVETEARVPGEGLFLLAAKATELDGGMWHYEYALHNLNSDRSGQGLGIPLPYHAHVAEIGFHDVNYHSGEVYTSADWETALADHTISWRTQTFDENPDANALRWGTLYNFRFESSAPPGTTMAALSLFKPGWPASVAIATVGPATDPDGDGNFDLADFAAVHPCLDATADPTEQPCRSFLDHNEDNLIDLLDFANLQNRFGS